MATDNLKPAYNTRLGNITAKSILVLLADGASVEGIVITGIARICRLTEINKRTALRVIQCFTQIGLVSQTVGMIKEKECDAFRINMDMLGLDLSREFAEAYKCAQGKVCRSDSCVSVAETQDGVAETQDGVAETLPPHPLKGMSPFLSLSSPPPQPPTADAAGELWPADVAVLVERLCKGCGFTANRRLMKTLGEVISVELESDIEPFEVVKALQRSWACYQQNAKFLRFQWGAGKFYGEGYWRNSSSWPWDNQAIERERERSACSVGTQRTHPKQFGKEFYR